MKNKNKISLLKKYYIFYKINKYFDKINKYFDNIIGNMYKLNNSTSFEEINLLLINKDLVTNFKLFINYLINNLNLYSYKKINTDYNNNHRKILTIYLITKFSHIILQNKTQYNEKLIYFSKKIIKIFNLLQNTKQNI